MEPRILLSWKDNGEYHEFESDPTDCLSVYEALKTVNKCIVPPARYSAIRLSTHDGLDEDITTVSQLRKLVKKMKDEIIIS